MAELDDIYSARLLELAANIETAPSLEAYAATASAHSKLCGSTIRVGLSLEDGRIAHFGQQVQACLLGQSAAAMVAREIVGSTPGEFRSVGAAMRRMLKEGGPAPTGRWAELGLLAPVKDYPHRHASTLLVFDAIERALDSLDARSGVAAAAT